jgi:hypothetical protein
MRKRLRFALVPGIGFTLACASLLLADPSASFVPCLAASDSCGGGQIEVTLNGDFKPTKLPKKKPAPVHFSVEGTIGMADGSNPPPLRELVLEIDKSINVDAKGLPACRLRRIEEADTATALKVCRPALVGVGKVDFVVAYPEGSPLPPESHAEAFNAGIKGGVRTIYIHSYLQSPVSAPVVMTVKASKVHEGRYGTKLAIAIPPIAKGFGFIKKFQLEFFRRFAYRHEKQSFVKARCFDGKLQAKAESIFSEGLPLVGIFKRPCTAKG